MVTIFNKSSAVAEIIWLKETWANQRTVQWGWWLSLPVCKTTRLPNKASVFRAELYAISFALSLIRRSKEKNVIIFSDSMSSLEAISGFKLEIDILQNIKDYTHLANTGKAIILCWIPKSCQYSWQWEGWHCSKINSFFARYKYEASSTWTYTMCFQVLFWRMARYMGLLWGK